MLWREGARCSGYIWQEYVIEGQGGQGSVDQKKKKNPETKK